MVFLSFSKIHPSLAMLIFRSQKLLLFLAFILLISTQGKSQVLIALVFGDKLNSDKMKFGLNVGMNVSDFTNAENSSYAAGLQFGIFIDYKLKDRLIFRPELNAVTNIVAKVDPYVTGNPELDTVLSNVKVQRKIKYGSLALFLKYNLKKDWYLETGPRGSLRFRAEDIFTATVFDDDDLVYTNNIRSETTLLDVGWAVGIGKKLFRGRGVYTSIRYYYGFVDVLKDQPGSQHVSSFQINASIPIVGKKKVDEKLNEAKSEGN